MDHRHARGLQPARLPALRPPALARRAGGLLAGLPGPGQALRAARRRHAADIDAVRGLRARHARLRRPPRRREARDLAVDIVMRPPVPLAFAPLLELVNQVTVGLLPPDIRRLYGFRWDPARPRGARRRGVRARRCSRCCRAAAADPARGGQPRRPSADATSQPPPPRDGDVGRAAREQRGRLVAVTDVDAVAQRASSTSSASRRPLDRRLARREPATRRLVGGLVDDSSCAAPSPGARSSAVAFRDPADVVADGVLAARRRFRRCCRSRLRARRGRAPRAATRRISGRGPRAPAGPRRARAAARRRAPRAALGLAAVTSRAAPSPRARAPGRTAASARCAAASAARRAGGADVAREPHGRGRGGDAVLVDPGDLGAERARDALAVRAVAGPHGHAAGPAAGGHARERDGLGSPAASTTASTGPGTGSRSSARRAGRRAGRRAPDAPSSPATRGPPHIRTAPPASASATSASTPAASSALASGPTSVSGRAGRRRAGAAPRPRARQRAPAPRPPRSAPTEAGRRPAPANAAHSAPATVRSSGAPSSTSIVPFAPGASTATTARARRSRRARAARPAARRGRGVPSARPREAPRARRRCRPAARRRPPAPARPRRAVAAADPDDADRRLQDGGGAPRAAPRPAQPPVGDRLRPLVGQLVQPGDARQQLGEQRLRARRPRSSASSAARSSSSSSIAWAARRR